MIFILALLIPLVAVILDSQLGRALAARLERGRAAGGSVDERLAALEGEVERLTREVQRLEDETDFLRRLLEAKPARGSALPSGEPND
ncbi:MAG TPA: hypothetical protein VF158_09370 [Longimicrobiales bacterium]